MNSLVESETAILKLQQSREVKQWRLWHNNKRNNKVTDPL